MGRLFKSGHRLLKVINKQKHIVVEIVANYPVIDFVLELSETTVIPCLSNTAEQVSRTGA